MLKLSIIVPVYNVSKYLAKCLDSLLTQDLKADEYEIIVVNDGSTDNSGEIAKEYADKYSNIILINQENQGLSGARNTGIKVAQGKYIQFVDSDDYLEPNVLKTLVDKMDNDKLDVLRFNYQNVKEDGIIFQPFSQSYTYNDYSDIPIRGENFLNDRMNIQCYAWQFIIQRDLLTECIFTIGILFEDTEWTPRMLARAKNVSSVEKVVYNYLWRESGITLNNSKEKLVKEANDKLFIIKSLKETQKLYSRQSWFQGMIASLVVGLVGLLSSQLFEQKDLYIQQIEELDILPLVGYHCTNSMKRKILLINFSLKLTVNLLHIKNQ